MSFHFESGVLSYRRADGTERGREPFWLTSNRDGSRTMRCLSMTDDSKFVRDVTYTLGTDLRTRDAFVRLQVDDAVVGAGSFTLGGERLEAEIRDAHGFTRQRLHAPERFHIVTHAVMLDGWSAWPYDTERGGQQKIPVYNTSTRWNGTDGPLGRMEELLLEHVGDETLEVPAGSYQCRHFTIDSELLDVPLSHIWVHGDDCLLVRYSWPGFDLEYVLTEHQRHGATP